ncbi:MULTISPECIES: helix-turn-helix transcriptional regulator [Streptomyces]|uniref:WYL domain-containing protein n=1 Tax=Streptomyces evansiae TaxID=3075535 RepID=A0ABD5ECL2_9ACTN|nr:MULTISPECIES: WYL domain-containing protein [unclassified Streptomyces]ASY36521.1 DNA-binding transcriptional regulator [Streptomyces sp. CLI2509]MDT0418393.1 WYL domain-containing protein [Streptomyces sp. DSM 41982]MYX21745.1 WYL domain-containing protein [Streptomyces sp. SID8380]SCD74049.1 HTH domain-containing protein [Streptomyces sp. SolWspMP-sol7th]
MQKTSSRLLALLSLLQAHRDWSGDALAQRLDVTSRTVRRDVDRLRELGYRIATVKGPAGGYRLEAGAQMPPMLFDDGQVVALAVALRTAAADASVAEDAARALATLRQVMPPRLRRSVDLLRVTAVEPPTARDSPPADPRVLLELSRVIQAREELRFDYVPLPVPTAGRDPGAATAGEAAPAAGGAPGTVADEASPVGELAPAEGAVPVHAWETGPWEPTPPAPAGPRLDPEPPRRVQPHHLVTSRHRWYLVAWDLDRADWRVFRVARIRPRTPTGPRFTPRELPGGSTAAFITSRFRGNDGSTADWPCHGEVVLRLPAAEVAPFAGDGIVEELGPDRCRLALGSWSWAGLAAAFARFDAEMEVIGPPRLAAAFATLAARASRAANITEPEPEQDG